ncbi:hypothetical protein NL676_020476 [Syzygium grande]|nr:hypothetical protein NL676_020476 [Syzygium grande]
MQNPANVLKPELAAYSFLFAPCFGHTARSSWPADLRELGPRCLRVLFLYLNEILASPSLVRRLVWPSQLGVGERRRSVWEVKLDRQGSAGQGKSRSSVDMGAVVGSRPFAT